MFDSWLEIMMDNYRHPDGTRGLTREQVAEAVEVDQVTVTRWLGGKRKPERRQVARLALLFRVNPDTILRLTDPDVLKEAVAEIDQHGVSAVLSTVPELRDFLEDVAKLPAERRAALILLARALAGQ